MPKALGGFRSGYRTRVVSRDACKWPQFLICSHECKEIVQLISFVSNEVEFELCKIEALHMAEVLTRAAKDMQ
ncbi:hypothetical protein BM613_14300 [Sulfoacidibacillus thermotolerans]|uniref:Uncharacterized protein n=1 Tax=Sulfoacidibacillus thermotolerans TaxID=1765684 RepID=A0A2U3CQG5_SULT2|nr:hypothetical protein BM613_14300 [Sulfoacidibacillus thermotolerans]